MQPAHDFNEAQLHALKSAIVQRMSLLEVEAPTAAALMYDAVRHTVDGLRGDNAAHESEIAEQIEEAEAHPSSGPAWAWPIVICR